MLRALVYPALVIAGLGGPACAARFQVPPANRVLEHWGEATVDALPARGIRVVIWNVHKARHRELVADLRRLSADADLVLLQEAVASLRQGAPRGVGRDSGWILARSFTPKRGGDSTGVATGSRARRTHEDARRSQGREPIIRTPKMVLGTRYELRGCADELLVVNVHALNFTGRGAFEDQLTLVEQMVAGHGGPVLLAGDFNTRSRLRMRALEALVRREDLRPVPVNPDGRPRVAGHPLDHAFVRGLEPLRASASRVRSSDHAPLVLELAAECASPPA